MNQYKLSELKECKIQYKKEKMVIYNNTKKKDLKAFIEKMPKI